jgi:2-hydroxy-6-oxo-octa-2,4-dienoate hydrolase
MAHKPDVLLLHGYGATSAFTWRLTIPALTEKFNVYAIDMPGFGRTEAPASLLVSVY